MNEAEKRLQEAEADIDNLITRFNTQQAMAYGLMNAMAAITHTLPDETKAQLRSQYGMLCGLFQSGATLGKTDLDALQIQREQFQKIGDTVFGAG